MVTRLVLMFQLYLYIYFLIGNRYFIEKMNIIFMMMNTLDMKKLQKAQELPLRANRLQKAKIEIHCVRPEYEPTEIKYQNEDFLKDLDLSLSSKIQLLCSYQTSHSRQTSIIFQIVDRCFPNQFFQAKRRDNCLRHYPMDSIHMKNFTP